MYLSSDGDKTVICKAIRYRLSNIAFNHHILHLIITFFSNSTFFSIYYRLSRGGIQLFKPQSLAGLADEDKLILSFLDFFLIMIAFII